MLDALFLQLTPTAKLAALGERLGAIDRVRRRPVLETNCDKSRARKIHRPKIKTSSGAINAAEHLAAHALRRSTIYAIVEPTLQKHASSGFALLVGTFQPRGGDPSQLEARALQTALEAPLLEQAGIRAPRLEVARRSLETLVTFDVEKEPAPSQRAGSGEGAAES